MVDLYCGFLPRLATGRMCAYPSLQGCIVNCGSCDALCNYFTALCDMPVLLHGQDGNVGMLCDKEDLAAILCLDYGSNGK